MNSSGDLITEARKRYVELNLLRKTTKQQTQTLLTHTINGEDQGTTNSERPEAIPTSNDGLMPLPNECLPREGGDPSITQDRRAFGNGSPPSRGRQNKYI